MLNGSALMSQDFVILVMINVESTQKPKSINFISAYSQAAMVEDKAEVFAHLITDPTFIEYRAKRSQVLQRKVDCIKRRMQAFCRSSTSNTGGQSTQGQKHAHPAKSGEQLKRQLINH